MSKKNKVNESDISFGIQNTTPKSKKEKQRTKKWFKDRVGRWTGTKGKKIMSNGPGKGKLEWDNIERMFSFGETAIKMLYQVAMERRSGTWVNEGNGTVPMRYGTAVEPLIDRAAKERLSKLGKLVEVGFKTFPNRPECGSSSDKIIINKKTKETIASVEYKACTTWETHYNRITNPHSEKGLDYWQMVNQTIAHEVDDCYYVIASPPHDIAEYVFYDGDIMDLYKKWKKECDVTIIKVTPSKTNKNILLTRLTIAEQIVCDYMSVKDGKTLQEVTKEVLSYFEDKPKALKNPTESLFYKPKTKKQWKKDKKNKKPKKS